MAVQEFSAASFFAWAPPLRALVQLLSHPAHRMFCCCMPLAATSLLPGHNPSAAEPLPAAVQVQVAAGLRLPDVSVSQAQRYRQRALLALRWHPMHFCCLHVILFPQLMVCFSVSAPTWTGLPPPLTTPQRSRTLKLLRMSCDVCRFQMCDVIIKVLRNGRLFIDPNLHGTPHRHSP
jgi:hypothetical protein